MPGFDSWRRALVFMRLGDLMVILSEGIPFCPFGRVSVAMTSWHCCSPRDWSSLWMGTVCSPASLAPSPTPDVAGPGGWVERIHSAVKSRRQELPLNFLFARGKGPSQPVGPSDCIPLFSCLHLKVDCFPLN